MLEAITFCIIFNLIVFIPAYLFRTDKLTDISYSLTFLIMIVYLFLNYGVYFSPVCIVLLSMILLWSARLGIYLLFRIHKIGRDTRFDGIRENFLKFLRFWLLQGITVFIVMIPTVFVFTHSNFTFVTESLFGVLLFLFGLIYESIADYQKFNFLKQKQRAHPFIHSGLWKYSRHPNYFGEIFVWIGVYLFSIFYLDLKYILLSSVSPIFIFVLLRYVSGIPFLERSAQKKYGEQTEYKNYVAQTPRLFPKFMRKDSLEKST